MKYFLLPLLCGLWMFASTVQAEREISTIYMVPGAGLEPARPQWPGDFKSPVSTNFTTRAGRVAERARRIPRERPVKTILDLKRSIFTPRTTRF